MKYAGLIKQSLVDYPGEIAAVLFTRGCNLRCPFCHNAHLLFKQEHRQSGQNKSDSIDSEMVLDFLQERKGFLDGVVISGGEPTLHEEIIPDLRRIKELGYLVKLDTNGSSPLLLERLLDEGLVDYVAMDIKAPLDYKKYQEVCGKLSPQLFCAIRNSIHLLRDADIRVEFRTTVVPVFHSLQDIEAIAGYIEGAALYSLQQFNPDSTLDPGLENVSPYSKEEMQTMADCCLKYVREVRVLNI
ncbi:MAG: anaerobic ribonucleoside-triphosphate reductase activating protein [Syntrophomonas sp.]